MTDEKLDALGRRVASGPPGTAIRGGKDGLQIVRSNGERWTEEAEALFLDHLAASCNVSASAEAAGFSRFELYKRRRRDAAFAKRWKAALEEGYVRIEALLIQRATDALEGLAPDPDTPIPPMTVAEAMALLKNHRAAVEGGARSGREWSRPRTLDEVRDSILAKLEAVAPSSPTPRDERDTPATAHPEEGLRSSRSEHLEDPSRRTEEPACREEPEGPDEA